MDIDFYNLLRKKKALLHRIHDIVSNSQVELEIKRIYTPEEKKMRILMGSLVMLTGYFAIFFMGLGGIFSEAEDISEISIFLISFGMGIALASSGYLYKVFDGKAYIGNIVFGLAFLASFSILIFGLCNIYVHLGTSVFLMVFGFFCASISALAMK